MTTDWAAPVAGAAVAIAGIAAPMWAARSKDRTDRQQRRREEVYVDTLTMAHRMGQWAIDIRPAMTVGRPAEPEEPPTVMQQHKILVHLGAFGSSEVERLYEDLVRLVNGFGVQDQYLREIERLNKPRQVIGKEDVGGADVVRIMGLLPAQHQAIRAARDTLCDQIKRELQR